MFISLQKVLLLAAACVTVTALPKSNFDIVPPITSPVAGQVWTIGSQQTVTWETDFIPSFADSQTGILDLGTIDPSTGNENLNTTDHLADSFLLTDGAITITVPDVTPGDDYILVLFGDSGNRSPAFTISA